MYTESIESEKEFVSELCRSFHFNMEDGEIVTVRECPKCHSGTVVTKCIHFNSNGHVGYRYRPYCDSCGEKFSISRMKKDIFFHTPYTMIEKLETPFGDIFEKINGRTVPIRYRTETCESVEEPPGKPIVLHIIDIDTTGLKKNDRITCGFETDTLEFNDGDVRAVLYSCENEELFFEICAYEPEELEDYCYQLEDYEDYGDKLGDFYKKGFVYRITQDPSRFDRSNFYPSKIISLAVAWVNKADYKDADTELFCSLTSVIG